MERLKAELVRKMFEGGEELPGPSSDCDCGAGSGLDTGPMWSRQPAVADSCRVTVIGGAANLVSSPGVNLHIGPVYSGSGSRPPSQPGSRPGSRSHSGARDRTLSPMATRYIRSTLSKRASNLNDGIPSDEKSLHRCIAIACAKCIHEASEANEVGGMHPSS